MKETHKKLAVFLKKEKEELGGCMYPCKKASQLYWNIITAVGEIITENSNEYKEWLDLCIYGVKRNL